MVEEDGLTDEKVPMLQKCGGGTVGSLPNGSIKPTLAERRNGLAHGDPFRHCPGAGSEKLTKARAGRGA